MNLTHISIRNLKALREIDIPASRFVCVIGENNSGKSTLLQALLLLVEGSKIVPNMYFDQSCPVVITARFESITKDDLSLVTNEEHRSRLSEILKDEAITLIRRYETGGASRLRWLARVPKDGRFKQEFVENLVAGKKAGSAFAGELKQVFPEIADSFDAKTNQKQAKALIEGFAIQIPETEKCDWEMDLPSGIDNSIRSFLPKPIYIPAVKDFADEIATKDSASFGKLLGILLGQIAPELEAEEKTFELLRGMLNRIPQDDGSVLDKRLEAVRNIETLVQDYVKENFPTVALELRIPPPEIKAILSGAEIWVDDGVCDIIDTKGDGLKRTVTFSILRSYVDLQRRQRASGSAPASVSNYLLLFEEPELYLHPTAQRILFDALAEISKTNHVFVSTHSPMFFDGAATGTFIKLAKRVDLRVSTKPFGQGLFVDLADLDAKSRFQIISYETNKSAFFSETVVLVEGDSDSLVMPHIARTLNRDWDPDTKGIAFCRMGGKGNISKYRKFFQSFEVRVCVITDLDCLLEGFELLEPSTQCSEARAHLVRLLDTVIQNEKIEGKIRAKDIKEMQGSEIRREQFQALRDTITKFKQNTATREEMDAAEERFFADLVSDRRLQVLQDPNRAEIVAKKHELIRLLRAQHVHVLERGAIDQYYPQSVVGADKPSRAIDFCRKMKDRESILELCGDTICRDGVKIDKEFTVLFSEIFENG